MATQILLIMFVIKLVIKEIHQIVKDEDKWGLAKSLTTHYKITGIFPFLKKAVCGQIYRNFYA
jgi:hypothetical protein